MSRFQILGRCRRRVSRSRRNVDASMAVRSTSTSAKSAAGKRDHANRSLPLRVLFVLESSLQGSVRHGSRFSQQPVGRKWSRVRFFTQIACHAGTIGPSVGRRFQSGFPSRILAIARRRLARRSRSRHRFGSQDPSRRRDGHPSDRAPQFHIEGQTNCAHHSSECPICLLSFFFFFWFANLLDYIVR